MKSLVSEYYLKRHYRDNLTELALKLIKDTAMGLAMLTLTVFQIGIFILMGNKSEINSVISLVLTVAFAGATFSQFNRVVKDYFDVILFEDYEKKVMAKIRKMGIPNPEEVIKQADESSKPE